MLSVRHCPWFWQQPCLGRRPSWPARWLWLKRLLPLFASAVQAAATHASATPSEKQAVATNAIQSTAEVFESPGLGSMLKKKRAAPVETLAPPQSIAAKIMTATPPDIKDGEADRLPDIEVPAVAPIQVPMDAGLAPDASVSDVSPLAMTIADSMLPKWHPMLQVDRIVWPSACSRLQGMAAEALDQMVDGLRKIQSSGKKVIGMASCGDGEGVSTLLLAAARRMSSQGLNVAVVDANLARPTLASAIGLLPQLGWENALSGDTPLEDVVIESEADHLAILPTIHAPAELSAEAVESHLATLAENFDSVLVDLGSLYAADGQWNDAASEIGARTGGMILVQNVRKTTPNRLADAQSHLEQSSASLVREWSKTLSSREASCTNLTGSCKRNRLRAASTRSSISPASRIKAALLSALCGRKSPRRSRVACGAAAGTGKNFALVDASRSPGRNVHAFHSCRLSANDSHRVVGDDCRRA